MKNKGAIVVGYQGIGKSTVADNYYGFIDLESSNFFVDGERPKGWEVIYCNIARHLVEQGYIVFMSSHKSVREELKRNPANRQYIVCPGLSLRSDWIHKLRQRAYNCKLYEVTKNMKALHNAEECYVENIQDLIDESGFEKIIITDMDYNLRDLLHEREIKYI